MGSLAAAIRLAAQGYEVEVFEKNGQLGGRMGRLEADGFAFDTGPSLLLMTDTYRELFASAGRDLDDYVRLIPLDGQYRVTFGDGDALTIRRTLPELIGELERIEPGVTPRFYRFLADACRKYRTGRSEFVERDLEGARDSFCLPHPQLLRPTQPEAPAQDKGPEQLLPLRLPLFPHGEAPAGVQLADDVPRPLAVRGARRLLPTPLY
jgi:phytoene desaturase